MWRQDSGFFRKLLDNLYDGVYFVDRNRIITYWNRGAERMSGFSSRDVSGRSCKDNILMHVDEEGRMLCTEGCPLAATLEDGRERQAAVYLHHKDGHRVPVLVRISPIHDTQGEIVGAVEIFSDNSARMADLQKIEELRQLVFLDPLTSVANRRYLEMVIRSRLGEMIRFKWPFGLLFLDVDDFKSLNDTFGHDVGDEVLKMIAKTLAGCARVYDTVGRWGGEEFLVIIFNIGRDDLRKAAERFRKVVEQSALPVGEEPLRVTVSIGATQAVVGDTAESLLARADRLMYQSKLLKSTKAIRHQASV